MSNKKAAIVSIIGRPNAGKSTLVNKICGQKISIVSPKVQTTRNVIRGIYTKDETQLVFLDTPGIFNPSKKLEKAMVRSAWSSIAGADIISIIIDLSVDKKFDEEFVKILEYLSSSKSKKLIVLNKMDLLFKSKEDISIQKIEEAKILAEKNLKKENIVLNLSIIEKLFPNSDSIFISAEKGDNINLYLEYLTSNSPSSEWMYEEDQVTTAPMKFLAEEITREKLFLNLSEELPYNLTVETDKWEQISETEAKIYQSVILKRDSHKKIVLGNSGNMIKKISTEARLEIGEAFEMKIHLFLFVKVRDDWDQKASYYKSMGLQYNKND